MTGVWDHWLHTSDGRSINMDIVSQVVYSTTEDGVPFATLEIVGCGHVTIIGEDVMKFRTKTSCREMYPVEKPK